jgi:hypothetical protein
MFEDQIGDVRQHQRGLRSKGQEIRKKLSKLEHRLGSTPDGLRHRVLEMQICDLTEDADHVDNTADNIDAALTDYKRTYDSITTKIVTVPQAAVVEQATQLPGCRSAGGANPDTNFVHWLETRDHGTTKENLIQELVTDLTNHMSSCVKVCNVSLCPDCRKELVYSTQKAMLICAECGASQSHLDATPACVAYDESSRREVYSSFTYTYKRMNHLFERISQLQSHNAPEVTPALMQSICAKLHEQRVAVDAITTTKVKDILKQLKCRAAYPHVVLITCRLQGLATPKLTRDTLDKLRRMFQAVQRPFERHCPEDRSNFLSYHYILYKFLELLGAYSLLPYLEGTLLKGRAKLAKQDAIWRKICADLSWQFIASV